MAISSNMDLSGPGAGAISSSSNSAGVRTPMGAFKLISYSTELLYNSARLLQQVYANRQGIGGGLEAAAAGVMVTTGGALAVPMGVALGAKALYDLTKWYFNNGGEDDRAKEVLDKAKAHNDLIQVLASANDVHLEQMQSGITRLEANIQEITERVVQIQAVADHGILSIAEERKRGVSLFEEAENISKEAKYSMESGKKYVEIANQQLAAAIKKLDVVIDLAKEEGDGLEERVNKIAIVALELKEEMIQAQGNLEKGMADYQRGQELNEDARAKEGEANRVLGAVSQASVIALEQISQIAKFGSLQKENEELKGELTHRGLAIEELQKQLSDGTREIRNLTDEVRSNNAEITRTAEEQAASLEELQQLQGDNYGAMSILVGLGTTAILSPAGGPLLGVAGGGSAMTLFHKMRRMRPNVSGAEITDSEARELQPGTVTYSWAKESSGYWGHYVQRKTYSRTIGIVNVKLPTDETLKIKFNLKSGGPDSRDVTQFAKRLNQLFKNGTLTARQCQDMIVQLKELKVDRGVRGGGWLESGKVNLFKTGYKHPVLDHVENKFKEQTT